MCHPGYVDLDNGDEFNRSYSREVEMNSLYSEAFQQRIFSNPKLKVHNFNYLCPSKIKNHKPRILLYSKMNSGCGNWTTSLRLQQIF